MLERFEDFANMNNDERPASKEELGVNIPFSSFRDINNIEDDRIDISQKHHREWVKQYPFLKQFNLETDYIHATKEHVWFYSLNGNYQDIEYSIFLEIRKKTTWSITLEVDTTTEDDFETKSKTKLEDSQSYEKTGLTFEQLHSYIREVSNFLKKWNANIQEEIGHSPLNFE